MQSPLILVDYLDMHTKWISTLFVDDDFLYTGSEDETIRIWDKKRLETITVLKSHNSTIWGVFVDDQFIYSASGDATIHVLNKQDLNHVHVLKGHDLWVSTVFVDNLHIYSGSGDTTIRVWDKKAFKLVAVLEDHKTTVDSIAGDLEWIYSGAEDEIIIWNKKTLKPIKRIAGNLKVIFRLHLDDKFLYAACQNEKVHIWDKKTLKPVDVLEGHTMPVLDVVTDEKFIYSCSSDGTVRVWSKDSLEQVHIEKVRGWVHGLAIDENHVYFGADSKLYVMDKKTFRLKKDHTPYYSDSYFSYRVFADHQFIYSAQCIKEESIVRIWDRNSLEIVGNTSVWDAWVSDAFSDEKFVYFVANSFFDKFDIKNFDMLERKSVDNLNVEEFKKTLQKDKTILPALPVGASKIVVARFTKEDLQTLYEKSLIFSKGVVIEGQEADVVIVVPTVSLEEEILKQVPQSWLKRIENAKTNALEFCK